jgi:hypothetical protein
MGVISFAALSGERIEGREWKYKERRAHRY